MTTNRFSEDCVLCGASNPVRTVKKDLCLYDCTASSCGDYAITSDAMVDLTKGGHDYLIKRLVVDAHACRGTSDRLVIRHIPNDKRRAVGGVKTRRRRI
ncbi:MAG: hypothetical protein U1F23_13195 [Lysobacterales bacterium]